MNPETIAQLGLQCWFDELAEQGVLLTDAELNIHGWNRWLEEHSGHEAAEMLGRQLLEVWPELATRGLDQAYKAALAGEARVLAQGFHRFLLPFTPSVENAGFAHMQQSARISPLTVDGRVVGTLTVIEDVTERVAREQTLRRQLEEREASLAREQTLRAKAEESNRLKDEFIATVSHELRTPLNHMLGWVLLLRNRQFAPEQAAEALAVIERNVRVQNSLIEDLLDTTRVLTGQLRCESQPVELSRVVAQAVAAAQAQAAQKNIRLQMHCSPGDCSVLGDADRLQQIVANLLSNAVKFTAPGGCVEVTLRDGGARAELTVADTGCGIAPEFLPHVFDPFRQQDGTRTRRAGGLGLGLSIVKHLVELHGGVIAVASPGAGQGTTFTVTLPLRAAGQGESEKWGKGNHSYYPPSPISPSLSGVRVLAVDDEPDTLALLAAILIPAGAELRQATSAAQAIALWRDQRPDVLVSDIGMPDVDGYELIRRLRVAEREMQHPPCPAVALTAYANIEERLRTLAAGYHMHLAKPAEPLELITIIASLTGRLNAKSNT